MAEVNLSLSQDFSDEDSCNSSQNTPLVDASREDITKSSGELGEFEELQRTAVTEFPEEENGSSTAMVKKNESFMRICVTAQNERDLMREMRSNQCEEHDDDDSFIVFEHNPSEEDSDKSSHEDENLSKQQSQQTSSGQLVGNPELPSVDVPSGLLVVNGSSETRRASHPQVKDGGIKALTEENQRSRKKCKAANKNLATLKEQLRSLKEEEDVIGDLTEENEQLEKEYDTAIRECAALEEQLQSLKKKSSTERMREESSTSTSHSSDIEFQEDSLGKKTQTELQSGQPPIDQSGEDEFVGGRELSAIKKGTEDRNFQLEGKFVKTTVAAINQFHQRREQPPSSGKDSAQRQPTSGNNNEEEMLSEVYYSVLCILETAAKILAQREPVCTEDMHNGECLSYCKQFWREFSEEQLANLPSPEQLVGMRNAAAHTNAEYRLEYIPGDHVRIPTVFLYEKKTNSGIYKEIYSSSTDELSQKCFTLRNLFLNWKPVRKILSLPASANSREDEVVSPAEEESESTNTTN